jgi:quinoprotein glucose dehydrogenase
MIARRPSLPRAGVALAALAALILGAVGLGGVQRGQRPPIQPLSADGSNFANFGDITKSNIGLLKVAWFYPYGSTGSSPIVVGEVAYVQGRNNSLVALDATTGKELWIHENLTGITPRGMNYWQSPDGRDRRILFSINSYLQAIDARTGQSILTFGANGIVDLREGLARGPGTVRIQSNSPGKIFENLLIIGSAPGEQWVSPPGDIRAYDVITGGLVWQFHTVPRPGEFGYDTWPPDAYKYVGGNNNWADMSVDEGRGIVYVPTGSPTYDFYGADRHGANLFGNCLIALDARSGRRLWHFQMVHHDLWDYDNVSAPQLITVNYGGRRIDAVAHAGKTGFLYVFDRVTGEPLWPIEERPVPPSEVPGEQAWPTQPFPTVVPPFARQTFTVDDVNPYLSASNYKVMRDRVAKARNLGLFTPPAFVDTIQMPGNQGGSNWGTTAANPDKGIVYVLNVDAVAILKLVDVKANTSVNLSGVFGAAVFQKYCQVCHGPEARGGGVPGAPALLNLTSRFSDEALKIVVTNGQGTMGPVAEITDAELNAVVAYLRQGEPATAGRGTAPAFPDGPIVASGGAPRPPTPAPIAGAPQFGGNGGNGGNTPYPTDANGVPTVRYISEYGVMAAATRPPYSTLTAYDLNSGAIKWRVPTGDDPSTISRGGPTSTGGQLLRTGMIPTRTGLVFLAGSDGRIRAFDENSGQALWTGTLPGGSRGVPAMYEANGRQYLLVSSVPAGSGANSSAPRGWIAFALSKH